MCLTLEPTPVTLSGLMPHHGERRNPAQKPDPAVAASVRGRSPGKKGGKRSPALKPVAAGGRVSVSEDSVATGFVQGRTALRRPVHRLRETAGAGRIPVMLGADRSSLKQLTVRWITRPE